MASRQFSNDSKTIAKGEVFLDFSFMTNGTGAVANSYISSGSTAGTTFRGLGITSVTRTGVGTFAVVATDDYRWCITKFADMEDAPGDGAYATISAVANEGTTSPITFTVKTWTAGGTVTDFGTGGTGVGRRVSISMCLKNSLAGV